MTKKYYFPADAPRLRAYIARQEGRRLLRMRRSEWAKARPTSLGPVLIDLRTTPMSKIALSATVIALTAQEVSPGDFELKLYREDPEDQSPYNVDTLSLWENIAARPDFKTLVAAASTDLDDNMVRFLEENVLIIPRPPASGHWLDEAELPTIVRGFVSKIGSSGAA